MKAPGATKRNDGEEPGIAVAMAGGGRIHGGRAYHHGAPPLLPCAMTVPSAHTGLSVGVDLVEVRRIAAILDGAQSLDALLTAAESDYCHARRPVAQHVAARFAAKEAVLKALGTGLAHGIRWTDVEVSNDASGRPHVHLHGAAAHIASRGGLAGLEVALSHTSELAVAHVVATWNGDDATYTHQG